MNEILYGHDSSEGLVSCDVYGNVVYEYYQDLSGNIHCNMVNNYKPWYMIHDVESPNFTGNNWFNKGCRLKNFNAMKGLYKQKEHHTDLYVVGDKSTMYMIETGKTLFKGMDFDEVHTVAFDIETNGLDPFYSQVKMISIVDNRGFKKLLYNENEYNLISEFIEVFNNLDPNIVLTFNGFNFDVPFLVTRAEANGLSLTIGRNNSTPIDYKVPVRLGVENQSDVIGKKLFGRHHIDLYYSVMKYDFTDRKLTNYKLKNIISQYGLEREGRVYVTHEEMTLAFNNNDKEMIEKISAYCLDDALDLIFLHRHICQAEFYLSQIIPMNYYKLMYTGSVGRINSIMMRHYLKERESMPVWSEDKIQIEGAEVQAEKPGIYTFVGDSDVRSLYPSLMINYDIFPKTDTINTMKQTLILLRDMRFRLKDTMKLEKNPVKKASMNGQQLAVKILLNCFHPETTVLTNNGNMKIKDINVGDIVQSINPNTLELEWKPVVAIEKKQKGAKMLKFTTTTNKTFSVTDGHNLASIEGFKINNGNIDHKYTNNLTLVRKEAKDFKVGELLPIPVKEEDSSVDYSKDAYFPIITYINDKDINVCIDSKIHLSTIKNRYKDQRFIKLMKYDRNSRCLKINSTLLRIEDKVTLLKMCEDVDLNIYLRTIGGNKTPIRIKMDLFLRFYGWFISEGSIYANKEKQFLTTKRGVAHKINIAQYPNVHPENYEEIYNLIIDMGFNCYREQKGLGFCSKPVYHILRNVFGNHGARTKRIPKEIMILKNKELKLLLDTYHRGDGNYLRSGKRRFSTCSETLKNDIIFILQRFGITYSVYIEEGIFRISETVKSKVFENMTYEKIKTIEEVDMPECVYDINVADNNTICVGDNGYVCTFQSYFGILGSNGFLWKDNLSCASVTRHGRELILKVKDFILSQGFQITALDTDGISYTNGKPFDIDEMNTKIESILPDSIEMESKLYKGIMIFKKKTYATLDDDDKINIKGAAITSSTIPGCIKRFTYNTITSLFKVNAGLETYDAVKSIYETTIKGIINKEFPISEFTKITKINKDLKDYLSLKDTPTEKGNKRADLPLYELMARTNRDYPYGEKVETYYAVKMVPKPLTKSQQKKKDMLGLMDTMFQIEEKPELIEDSYLQWADLYNNDVDVTYYLKSLKLQIENLFSHIMPIESYNYCFDNLSFDMGTFIYKDTTEKLEDGRFTVWNRIDFNDELELIKNSGSDIFTTVLKTSSNERIENERLYGPLYFDLDSQDLEEVFNDVKVIYNYFRNMLKIEDCYINVWYSGSKGFHVEIDPRIFGITALSELNKVYKIIAQKFIDEYQLSTIDIGSIYSNRRMWRLPFSVHGKTGVMKTLVPNFNNFNDIESVIDYVKLHNEDSKEEYFKRVYQKVTKRPILELWYSEFVAQYYKEKNIDIVRKPKWKYDKLAGKLPSCVEFLIKNSISKAGDRNKASIVLLSFYKESSISKDEAVDNVVAWTLNIKDDLTSLKDYAKILSNVKTIADTVYNSDKYCFECYFIKGLISDRGFNCGVVCNLRD